MISTSRVCMVSTMRSSSALSLEAHVTYYAPAVEDMNNPEKVAEAAKKAFTGAKYIISSGGAPRKAGMTREDLLQGNCKIAADFGENIKKYCPDVKHVVVIFNPADVTALTTLIHSGLESPTS